MKALTILTTATVVLLVSACADQTISSPALNASQASRAASANAGLKLHPDGFGPHTIAAWRAHEGLPDSHGNADQALYLQKFTATETNAAAVARITGLEGQPLSALVGLSWEHRTDGWCGAGAPRWDVIVSDQAGNRGVIFLGCAAAVHTPGSGPGWIRDSYPGLGGVAIASLPATGFTPAFNPSDALTISELLIVFDEGTTAGGLPLGPGFVYLDNIVVNDQTWTSPADNGN
ncbi:MAG TPA: hypothetical protein VGD02_05280 [Gemmatimonadaceae bacterium]|jgi:hypothetical protein